MAPKITIKTIVKNAGEITDEIVTKVWKLNKAAWGSEELGGTKIQIKSRLQNFPEGQLGAFLHDPKTNKEILVGVIQSVRGDVKKIHDKKGNVVGFKGIPTKYREVTGDGYFANHNPNGNALYCVSVASDPDFRRYQDESLEIGSRLVGAAIEYAHTNDLEPFAYSRPVYKAFLKFLENTGVKFNWFQKSRLWLEQKVGYGRRFERWIKEGNDPITGRSFHSKEVPEHKPAGKIIKIFRQGRRIDNSAAGYNVIVHYPKSQYDKWKAKRKTPRG